MFRHRKGAFLLILRAWGVEMEAGEYDKLWDGLPKNDIGRLGGKEFKELARQPIQNITLPAVVESDVSDVTHMVVQRALDRFGSLDKALASFVPDDSGDISMTQLKMFLKTCGCTLSPNEVKELTAALDKHGTGAVNLTALTAKVRCICVLNVFFTTASFIVLCALVYAPSAPRCLFGLRTTIGND